MLGCLRVKDLQKAVDLINAHEFGNGIACFTRDGNVAREFCRHIQVGMVVSIPVPMVWLDRRRADEVVVDLVGTLKFVLSLHPREA